MPDLAGKDYFTKKEAAAYCCVSESQFERKIGESGLVAGKLWGKKLFRRSDLQKLIEETAWPRFNGVRTNANQGPSRRRPTLIGGKEASNAERA